MAQKPDGKAKGAGDRVAFSRAAADRIARVVLEVEGGDRDNGGLQFGHRPGAAAKAFRVATFSGEWLVGSQKTVTLKYTPLTSTVSAVNVFLGMNPTAVTECCVARDGTSWHCISADLTKQPGYSASGTHVLTIQNGTIRWVGTTACA